MRMIFCALSICLTFNRTTSPARSPRRRLLLQRLGQFARAGLHLVEQPHVLDRDHRLVCEGRDKLDLLVGE